jgi:hypothetical protein
VESREALTNCPGAFRKSLQGNASPGRTGQLLYKTTTTTTTTKTTSTTTTTTTRMTTTTTTMTMPPAGP